MKLADLRRLAVRRQLQIHFRLANGLECVVNREGVAQVPGLKAAPDFNLEDALTAAGEFLVEPVPPGQPQRMPRAEVESLATTSVTSAAAADHDDE